MAEDILLVATGPDRPGVMNELSQFLLESGGNIIDSRSSILRGRYAILLLVRMKSESIQALRNGLAKLAETGIQAEIHPASTLGQDESTFPYVFTASGKDQVGVMQRLSHLLRVLNVNIENMQTRVSADETFQLRLELAVPRQTPVASLKDYLTYLCSELGIDWGLKEA